MTDESSRKKLKEKVEWLIDNMDIPTVKLLSAFMNGMIVMSMWDANNFTKPTEVKTDIEDILAKMLVKIIEKASEKR